MERRFAARIARGVEDAVVDPRVFRDGNRWLEKSRAVCGCLREGQQRSMQELCDRALSDLKRKTVEAVAYCTTGSVPVQKFMGCSPWDERPLLGELARRSAPRLGEADGVIVLIRRLLPKRGAPLGGRCSDSRLAGRQG